MHKRSEVNLKPLVSPTPQHRSAHTRTQEWECRYLLTKARRLRDATATLRHRQASNATSISMINSQAPAYVASRVGGAALPEVEVEGRLGSSTRRRRRRGVDDGMVVREDVVRHVVEGLRGELVREMMVRLLDV
jgi:hypothetical protein